jgi:hypothetical protein
MIQFRVLRKNRAAGRHDYGKEREIMIKINLLAGCRCPVNAFQDGEVNDGDKDKADLAQPSGIRLKNWFPCVQ